MKDPSYWALVTLYNRLAIQQERADAGVNASKKDVEMCFPRLIRIVTQELA